MADKVMFKPIKTAWNELMFDHRRKTQNANFPLESFAPMLKLANDRAVNDELVKTGFRVTGWYPFDKDAVDYSLCLSENTDQPIDAVEEEPDVPEEDYLQREVRLMQQKLSQMKKDAIEAGTVKEIWGKIGGLGNEIDTVRQPTPRESHFPALQQVLVTPTPPKRKGTRNYRVNMPPVLTGSLARNIIEGMNVKADEILLLKTDKKAVEEQIKTLRATIAAEKKRAPRKKKGQAVQETESEIDLQDLLHRKTLMQERLKELTKKPHEQENNEPIGDESEEEDEEEDNVDNLDEIQCLELAEIASEQVPSSVKRRCIVKRNTQKKLRNK